jgi:hypothetical protein
MDSYDREQQYLEDISAEGEALNQIEIEKQNNTLKICSRCGTLICSECMFDPNDSPLCNNCKANICSGCLGMHKVFKGEGN